MKKFALLQAKKPNRWGAIKDEAQIMGFTFSDLGDGGILLTKEDATGHQISALREAVDRVIFRRWGRINAPFVEVRADCLKIFFKRGYENAPIKAVHALSLKIVEKMEDAVYELGQAITLEDIQDLRSFSGFLEGKINSIAREVIQQNSETAKIFWEHSKFIRPQKEEPLDLDRLARTFVTAFRNPIFLFYYCYFLSKHLKGRDYQIDFEAMHRDLSIVLDIEPFGVDPQGRSFDCEGGFLKVPNHGEIAKESRLKTGDRCPALSKTVFLKLKRVFFEILDALCDRESNHFERLEQRVKAAPEEAAPEDAFRVGILYDSSRAKLLVGDEIFFTPLAMNQYLEPLNSLPTEIQ